MPEYLYPGVYVEEVDTGNKPIEGVSTSTTGFIGITSRGPLEPTLVTSFSEFTRLYGSYFKDSDAGQSQRYLAYAIEGFFQNGGRRAFVARVAGSAATPAEGTFDGKIKVTALGPGPAGLRIAVSITPHTPADGYFDMLVMYFKTMPASPTAAGAAILEAYQDLSDVEASSAFYEKRINNLSSLVRVAKVVAGLPAAVAPTLLATGGVDDNTYTLADFDGSASPDNAPIGLKALKAIDEISILTCPDEYAIAGTTVAGALVTQCELLKDRFAILNSLENAGAISGQHPSKNSKYAAYYYPWLRVVDPLNGKVINVPPSGHMAGIYARSDNERGVHKDPANEVIRGIDSLQIQISKDQQALLNPRGVNVLRHFVGAGDLVWGGRTTSPDPDWKYINVRRLFIFIEDSIEHGTGWVVFEPNDYPTWTRVVRSISAFLERAWMDGMLQGRTKEEAFFVRCDRTTMTQADIDNGRLICLIGIAPVKPAEFVIFRIGQWTGGSDVAEQ